ncbi:MAG: hypothetical protein R3C19_13890 [Planctomycetaceae bacterium]
MRPVSPDSELRSSLHIAMANLLIALAVGLLYSLSAFSGPPLGGSILEIPLKLLFLAMVVLTLKNGISGVLLFLMLVDLFFREPQRLRGADLGAVYDASLAMLLLLSTARFRTVARSTGLPGLRSLLKAYFAGRHSPGRSTSTVSLDAAFACGTKAVVCVLSAWMFLSLIPSDTDAMATFRLRPNLLRAIIVALILTAVWLIGSITLNHLAWRTLSPAQARIYLRGVFLHWNHRDLRMIVLRKLKHRRRSAARSVKADSSKSVPSPTQESGGVSVHS